LLVDDAGVAKPREFLELVDGIIRPPADLLAADDHRGSLPALAFSS
jgi:hypothetical protein